MKNARKKEKLPHKENEIMKTVLERREYVSPPPSLQLFENSSSILIQSHQEKGKNEKSKRKTLKLHLFEAALVLETVEFSTIFSIFSLFLFKVYSVSVLIL